jgi:hypothetical protein
MVLLEEHLKWIVWREWNPSFNMKEGFQNLDLDILIGNHYTIGDPMTYDKLLIRNIGTGSLGVPPNYSRRCVPRLPVATDRRTVGTVVGGKVLGCVR